MPYIFSQPSTVTLPLNAKVVALGDSQTSGSNGVSYLPYGVAYSGGRYYCPPGFNGGVSGNTTTQMLARVATYTAMSPRLAVVLGGINDFLFNSIPQATTQSNLTSIYNAFIASGAHVLAMTVLPCNHASYTPTMEVERQSLNAWILSQAGPNISVLNCDAVGLNMTIPTGSPDGLHCSSLSAQQLARAVGNVMASLSVATPITSLGYGQIPSTRGLLAGSVALSGNNSGVIATGWSCTNNSGATNVGSKGTDAAGNITQIFTLSGTVTLAGLITFQTSNNYTWVPGDVQDGWIAMYITGVSGGVDGTNPPQVADSTSPFAASPIVMGPCVPRIGQSRNAQATTGNAANITTIWGVYVGLGAISAVVTYSLPYFTIVPQGVWSGA